jgi:peptidyl-prolyl cis-trans isomerase C
MKVLSAFAYFCSILLAQAPAPAPAPDFPDLPDTTVIAVFDDGTQFSLGDYKKLYAALPGNQQAMTRNRKEFLEQYGLMRKLALMAEKEKLDQTSPNKEALAFNRLYLLSQAKLNQEVMGQSVEPEEIDKAYEARKEQYKQVRVKAIYIMFTKAAASQASNGKRLLTQEEAKAKAQALLAQIRAGADFVKLVRENSDDAPSKEKDGDFATLRPTDQIGSEIKNAVFALKQGEVTEPIEQANGYYLLKAEEIIYHPLSEVRSDLIESLRQERFRQWLDRTRDSVKVQFPSAAFLGQAPAPPPAK